MPWHFCDRWTYFRLQSLVRVCTECRYDVIMRLHHSNEPAVVTTSCFYRPHPKDDGRLCFNRLLSVQLLEGAGTYIAANRGEGVPTYLEQREGVPTLDEGYLPAS